MTTGQYTSEQLVALTGIGIRTFRHWVRFGILNAPHGHGPAARYDEDQLARVRAAQALRARTHRLSQIKQQLSSMTIEQMRALGPQPAPNPAPTADPAPAVPATVANPAPSTPAGYNATPCEVIELIPGLTLTVAQNRGEFVRRIATEIWERYGSGTR